MLAEDVHRHKTGIRRDVSETGLGGTASLARSGTADVCATACSPLLAGEETAGLLPALETRPPLVPTEALSGHRGTGRGGERDRLSVGVDESRQFFVPPCVGDGIKPSRAIQRRRHLAQHRPRPRRAIVSGLVSSLVRARLSLPRDARDRQASVVVEKYGGGKGLRPPRVVSHESERPSGRLFGFPRRVLSLNDSRRIPAPSRKGSASSSKGELP